jgi:hypothetical protein
LEGEDIGNDLEGENMDVLMDEYSLKWLKYSSMLRKLGNLVPKFGMESPKFV